MTTGGTESIMMACKAYRDYAREEYNITRPNIVLPRTAHSAFDKAAQYLGLHIKYIDVDPKTTQVDVVQMEKTINRNTIMVKRIHVFYYGTHGNTECIQKCSNSRFISKCVFDDKYAYYVGTHSSSTHNFHLLLGM